MDKKTLQETRQKVYVLLKIIKYCTGSSAKSYQCKFAVYMVFLTKDPSSYKIGDAIRDVINYTTIRGMFNSVNLDLKLWKIKTEKFFLSY